MRIQDRNDRVLFMTGLSVLCYVLILVLVSCWSTIAAFISAVGAAVGIVVLRNEILRIVYSLALRRFLSPIRSFLLMLGTVIIGAAQIGRIKLLGRNVRSYLQACPVLVRAAGVVILAGTLILIGWFLVGVAYILYSVVVRSLLVRGLDRIATRLLRPMYEHVKTFAKIRGLEERRCQVRRMEARTIVSLRKIRAALMRVKKR